MRELSTHEKLALFMCEDKTQIEVAKELDIMPQTVKDALARARFKLGVSTTKEAIAKAKELGYEAVL